MKKFYRVVDEQKFYCDEVGALIKDEQGNPEEVPETDTETQEVDEAAVDEVSKMLGDALVNAKNEHEKSLAESLETASKSFDTFFTAVSKRAEKASGGVPQIATKSSFDVEAAQKALNDLYSGNRQAVALTFNSKADFDYLAKSTSEGDLTGDVIAPERVPGVSRDPQRTPFIESIADTTDMQSNALRYTEVTGETGAPASTAELGTIPEKDFTFQAYDAPLKKINVSNKHSVELLQDAPQLVTAIQNMLQVDMNLEVDDQLLNGDGTGSNLEGVIAKATTYDGTGVGNIANANLFDVLRTAMTQIYNTGKGRFMPTHVVLNPDDAQDLDLTKNSNGDYILPPFYTAEGQSLKGARIITNTGITAGDFLVGDFTKLHVGRKGGVEVEFTNSDGTDFAKDILTVKMRRRVASYVRNNDSGAFQTGTIATVITNLTS